MHRVANGDNIFVVLYPLYVEVKTNARVDYTRHQVNNTPSQILIKAKDIS